MSDPLDRPPLSRSGSVPPAIPTGPSVASSLPSLASGSLGSPLGSLAQQGRDKSLKRARITLFVIGGLTILMNLALFAHAETEVKGILDAEIAAVRAQGMQPDPVKVAEKSDFILRFCRIFYGSLALVGVAFIVLGLLVRRFPVPATVIALILYVAVHAVLAYLDVKFVIEGFAIKLLILAALVSAVKAAFATQRAAQLQSA